LGIDVVYWMNTRYCELAPLGKVAKHNLVNVNDGFQLTKFVQYEALHCADFIKGEANIDYVGTQIWRISFSIVVIVHLNVYRKHSQFSRVMASACLLFRDSAIPYEQP
jgi:hypothetical protein